MSNPIVPFGEEAVKSELRELARKTIEETVDAMLDEETDQLAGPGHAKDAQAQGHEVRDGDHRALQAP